MIAYAVIQAPFSLPVGSKTHHPREPHRNRGTTHDKALDAAELCRRLHALRRQDRTGRYTPDIRQPKWKQPIVSSGPYHHVPCTAARDFTRTTALKVEFDKAAIPLSQSLPARSCRVPGFARRSPSRRDSDSKYGIAESNPKTKDRLSLTSKQTFRRPRDAAGLQIPGNDKSRMALRKDQVREPGDTMYDSLVETRGGGRRSSTGNVCSDSEHLAGVEHGLQPGTNVLAHKITRQHLEDKAAADWTQSDAGDDHGKQFLREWIAPLLRSVAPKSGVDSDTVADDLTSSEKQLCQKKVSRRRSSLLPRYFVKKTTE